MYTFKTLDTAQQLRFVVSVFALLSIIEVLNILTGRALNQFGLVPRDVAALPGILFSPFLHGNLWHFFSNIVPICVFCFFMLQYGTRRFAIVTLFIILLTGLLVWLFGREARHVGISGLVYGYFGFLILAGFLSRRPKLIVISLIVGFFYGGLIFGVLPSRPFVSWESHFFGFITGLVAAKRWVNDQSSKKNLND